MPRRALEVLKPPVELVRVVRVAPVRRELPVGAPRARLLLPLLRRNPRSTGRFGLRSRALPAPISLRKYRSWLRSGVSLNPIPATPIQEATAGARLRRVAADRTINLAGMGTTTVPMEWRSSLRITRAALQERPCTARPESQTARTRRRENHDTK